MNHRFTRRAGLPAALLIAGLALAGCSTPTAEPTRTTRPDTLSGTVTVFAAASLTETFDALGARFEREHPKVHLVFSYGGSSALATQITQGAPADVFAAASPATMKTVTDAGDASDPTIFTSNTLEIAVPKGNPGKITGLADLADPAKTVALCDVAVPCGAAAKALFDSAGLSSAPDTLEEDVKAVLTKVELGEADAGLVYRSDVLAAGTDVQGIELPEAAKVVTSYPIAVLKGAPSRKAAQAFVDYVLSKVGQKALTDAGFGPAK
ncbi:MAG TPA: molybdate ABC transporter substrate-binding protein [Pseudolysinimonas sp.]|nr:molybdate ABC transporter substrate-binding protein [Pseudolysinimonas sp.]